MKEKPNEPRSFSLVEETSGWKTDIDRLQIAFQMRKKSLLLSTSFKRVKLLKKLGMDVSNPKKRQSIEEDLDPLVLRLLGEKGKLTEKQKQKYSKANLKRSN